MICRWQLGQRAIAAAGLRQGKRLASRDDHHGKKQKDDALQPVPISEAPERADPSQPPDCAAEDRQMFTAVLKAIQRLPVPQREALVLSLDEDLRYDQIGAIIGCSVAAVKVRIHRARMQLRSDLQVQEGSHGKRNS